MGNWTTISTSTPTLIEGIDDVTGISVGRYHSVAITSDGDVWAWGYNYDGELGNGSTEDEYEPNRVQDIYDTSGYLNLDRSVILPTNETDCLSIGNYWCDGACQKNPCDSGECSDEELDTAYQERYAAGSEAAGSGECPACDSCCE